MVSSNLQVPLDVREDKDGQLYYIGRLSYPGTIQLEKGATFLVFTSESGDEVIQIACNNAENTTFSKYTRKSDRLKIKIDPRLDSFKKTFFVAKIQMNGYIKCDEEVVFLVFTSKSTYEELQIVGDIVQDDNLSQKKIIEIYQGSTAKNIEL